MSVSFNIQKMLKQVQKAQEDMQRVQEELKDRVVEGTAGGGMVKVQVNGKQEVVSIQIDPQVVDPDDVGMLQDLVQAAVNEALRQSQEMAANEMAKITSALGIPKIPGLPGM
ncbi:MAG: YbaB/EbfC family nucleoid-associated protein [Firmicutes bacterium]|nr:YbaB/EbfC family nucleoid-associated protein [Bacillota bacterium]